MHAEAYHVKYKTHVSNLEKWKLTKPSLTMNFTFSKSDNTLKTSNSKENKKRDSNSIVWWKVSLIKYCCLCQGNTRTDILST